MSLLTRFNLALAVIFAAGLCVSSYFSYTMENRQAREQLLYEANLVLSMAVATRDYTVHQAAPLLAGVDSAEFIKQTVPSYAAQQTLGLLQRDNPLYSYREVALNPTNLDDLPTDWEVGIIRSFREQPDLETLHGGRETELGSILYIAQPIRITDPGCLSCHGAPEDARESMRLTYGTTNGYGWELGETIGAQIVSVPMDQPYERARTSFFTIVFTQVGLYALVALVISIMVRRLFAAPLEQIADFTERSSLGENPEKELPTYGTRDLDRLRQSVGRLSTSLSKSLSLLKQRSDKAS